MHARTEFAMDTSDAATVFTLILVAIDALSGTTQEGPPRGSERSAGWMNRRPVLD
jgi:hypothetical protein